MAAEIFARSGREPFRWIEIDQDFCQLFFGVPPCPAELSTFNKQCFNTRATCQAPAAYDRGVLTLRFCEPNGFMPMDAYTIPSLSKVKTNSSKINPGGVNQSSGSIGTRASISISFLDHPHNDRLVDKYTQDRPYNPMERGTFWTKWRARNPYYLGRAIRYKTGYIVNGQVDPATVITQTYFITGFAGPDADGNVSIQGQDVFSLVADEKAQAPKLSSGRLLAELTIDATSFTLDPIGIGSLEYPAAGKVRIGKEVMSFTRVGDVMTVVRRQAGSEGNTAKAGDVVQLCLEFSAQRPDAILYTLLHDFGGLEDQYLDTVQWDSEQTDFLPRLYSALITTPTGITTLAGEMSEQMYFYPWWDERVSKVKIRAVRPAEDDTVYPINDDASLIGGSVSIRDLTDQLITQVWVYYGLINAAGSLTDPNNYAAVRIKAALSEEGEDKQRQSRVKTIFSRWISALNAAAAEDLGDKLIARYSSVPREVAWTLDAKDRNIYLGDFVQISDRLNVSDLGEQQQMNVQIFSMDEVKHGTHYQYRGQQFVFEQPVDPTIRPVPIAAADIFNYNLRTAHDAIYAPPVGGETIICTVRTGAYVGGNASADLEGYLGRMREGSGGLIINDVALMPLMLKGQATRQLVGMGTIESRLILGTPVNFYACSDRWVIPPSFAFDTGDWPPGVTLILIVEPGAFIYGQGGYGSAHTGYYAADPMMYFYMSDGGSALRIRYPIAITNNGKIYGGCGGGAASAHAFYNSVPDTTPWYRLIGGAGGQGFPGGRATLIPIDNTGATSQTDPTNGTRSAQGIGGYSEWSAMSPFPSYAYSGKGGQYGAGTSGARGEVSTSRALPSNPVQMTSRLGGELGYCVGQGADLITWDVKGDTFGQEIN